MYSSEDLKKAVEAVNSGRLSLREATKVYKIPKSTISDKKDDVRKKLVKTMPRKLKKFGKQKKRKDLLQLKRK